jgi:hypothetical protein
MISASGLSEYIQSNLTKDSFNFDYVKSVKSYVEFNIEIISKYVGLTPSGNPDPLNGVYNLDFKFIDSFLLASNVNQFLRSCTENSSPNQWLDSLYLDMVGSTVGKANPIQCISLFKYSSNYMDLDDLKSKESSNDAWLIVCTAIINTIKSMKTLIEPIPTTTVSGTGFTTIQNVI